VARGARAAFLSGPVRAVLAIPLLGGAAWFGALALQSGAVALGITPAHSFANALAAVLLTPAVAACAVPLLDAFLAVLLGKDGAERWSRIMIEAAAALIFACLASVISAALWPGVAVLALATALGLFAGFLRWRPDELPAREPAALPLLLLLFDERPRTSAGAHAAAAQVPSEGEAA
jgi:hypothetical protein